MPATVPSDPAEVVAFAAVRRAPWEQNQAAIGMTPQQFAAFADALDAAQQARSAALKARLEARSATLSYYLAARTLRDRCAQTVRGARNLAQITGNGQVYGLARIDPPRPRRRHAPPPAPPFGLRGVMHANGYFELTWRARHPGGVANVVYEVRRRLDGKGGFAVVTVTGAKEYLDPAIPPGTRTVEYVLRALHGDRRSPPAPIYLAFLASSAGSAASGASEGARTIALPVLTPAA